MNITSILKKFDEEVGYKFHLGVVQDKYTGDEVKQFIHTSLLELIESIPTEERHDDSHDLYFTGYNKHVKEINEWKKKVLL